MEQSVRLGRIAGIEVGFNWSLLVVFWLISWSLAAGRLPQQAPGYDASAYWIAGVATATIFFASLLAHEMGHALVARRSGVKVEGITLWLFGGVAKLRGEAMTPAAELRITAVGPAVSLLLAALFTFVGVGLQLAGAPQLLTIVFTWLGFINGFLALFNLIPAFPLDGGRVLRAFLWRKRKDRLSATRSAARAGRFFGYGLIVVGLFEVAAGANIGGLWLVFLGWFLLGAARAEESHALMKGALKDVSVADIMSKDPVTVPAVLDLDSFLTEYALRHRFSSFPVEEGEEVIGLVTLTGVKEVAGEDRAATSIRSVARPLEEVPRVALSEPATALLEKLQGGTDGRALVFDDGRLVGIVSPRDVQRALELVSLRGVEPAAA